MGERSFTGTVASPGLAQVTHELLSASGRLARTASAVAARPDDVLRELCQVVPAVIDVAGVGVMAADGPFLRLVHAEPQWVVGVERLQEQFQRGPCCDSVSRHHLVTSADVTVGRRLPALANHSASTGVRAVASVPPMAQGRAWGTLDLYRRRAGAWTGADLSAVTFCVDIAASYLALVAQRDHWQAACRQIEHRSNHDQLTGLPTRGLLLDRLEHAVATATRHANAVAVLFIDVDGFKRINDKQGHAVGDLVLAAVARRLSGTLRANDTLARLSGDEFVIVCEDLTGTPAQVDSWLRALGQRIHAELRRPPASSEVEVNVSVSIGVCTTTEYRAPLMLLADADRAMYQAKRRGGGQLMMADTELSRNESP